MKLSNGLGTLVLQCRKCTRESTIAAPWMELAVNLAKADGWVMEYDIINARYLYVCPACPSGARKVAA